MSCVSEVAALLVTVLTAAVTILAIVTNASIVALIEVFDNIGLNTDELYDLKIKWYSILALAVGNILVWGLIGVW